MVLGARIEFFDFTAKTTQYYGKSDFYRDIITFSSEIHAFKILLENWWRKMVLRAQTEFFDFTAKTTRYYGKNDFDRDIITFFI